jgi:hypothetical protein
LGFVLGDFGHRKIFPNDKVLPNLVALPDYEKPFHLENDKSKKMTFSANYLCPVARDSQVKLDYASLMVNGNQARLFSIYVGMYVWTQTSDRHPQ